MKCRMPTKILLASLTILSLTLSAVAHGRAMSPTSAPSTRRRPRRSSRPSAPYSPYAGRNFPARPFFGDTHLHTSFSLDAGAFGARLVPSDAYRFAKGEEVTASSGQPAKLSRPLDFLVVADHSDNMGFFPELLAGKPEILADPDGRSWYDMIQSGKGAEAAIEIVGTFSQGTFPRKMIYLPVPPAYRSALGRRPSRRRKQANDPGRFTAFIGYEWTSNTGGNNLHRNVDLPRQRR